MMTDQRAKLAYVNSQIDQHRMYGDLWLAKINCGAAYRSKATRLDGTPLPSEENVDRAIQTVYISTSNTTVPAWNIGTN